MQVTEHLAAEIELDGIQQLVRQILHGEADAFCPLAGLPLRVVDRIAQNAALRDADHVVWNRADAHEHHHSGDLAERLVANEKGDAAGDNIGHLCNDDHIAHAAQLLGEGGGEKHAQGAEYVDEDAIDKLSRLPVDFDGANLVGGAVFKEINPGDRAVKKADHLREQ